MQESRFSVLWSKFDKGVKIEVNHKMTFSKQMQKKGSLQKYS